MKICQLNRYQTISSANIKETNDQINDEVVVDDAFEYLSVTTVLVHIE